MILLIWIPVGFIIGITLALLGVEATTPIGFGIHFIFMLVAFTAIAILRDEK